MAICILKFSVQDFFSTGFICGDLQRRLTQEWQFGKAGWKKAKEKNMSLNCKGLCSFLYMCNKTHGEQTAFLLLCET